MIVRIWGLSTVASRWCSMAAKSGARNESSSCNSFTSRSILSSLFSFSWTYTTIFVTLSWIDVCQGDASYPGRSWKVSSSIWIFSWTWLLSNAEYTFARVRTSVVFSVTQYDFKFKSHAHRPSWNKSRISANERDSHLKIVWDNALLTIWPFPHLIQAVVFFYIFFFSLPFQLHSSFILLKTVLRSSIFSSIAWTLVKNSETCSPPKTFSSQTLSRRYSFSASRFSHHFTQACALFWFHRYFPYASPPSQRLSIKIMHNIRTSYLS